MTHSSSITSSQYLGAFMTRCRRRRRKEAQKKAKEEEKDISPLLIQVEPVVSPNIQSLK
jgi:hypothetical protein